LPTLTSVRAELVEEPSFYCREKKNSPSTSSGRTVRGWRLAAMLI